MKPRSEQVALAVLLLILAGAFAWPIVATEPTPQTSASINAATGVIVIAPGEYTLDKPLIIGANKTLIAWGATFTVAHAGDAVVINGQRGELYGGKFVMPAGSTAAVIRVKDCTLARIRDVNLVGGSQQLGTGLMVEGDQATYFVNATGLQISDVATGIKLGRHANGCDVSGYFMQRVSQTGLWIDGGIENRVSGFHHGGNGPSAPSIVAVKLSSKALLNVVHITAEPGGQSKPYVIDADCNHNQISSQLNCSGAISDKGTGNLIVRFGAKRNF